CPVCKVDIIEHCELNLAQHGGFNTALRVINKSHYYDNDIEHDVTKLGCQFLDITQNSETNLQRFIDTMAHSTRHTL
ncbi:MAG: hypothetical protein HUJ30_09680, partial [Gammaproteobacteria bacterium]|nr:hypothetical protein [Gammaproteobacteria bacterium]